VVPGAVAVVVVPELPAERPEPTVGLLRAVTLWLEARRPITCRVCVLGPEYQKVRVRATVQAAPRTAAAVRRRAEEAVRDLLHPLRGGPSGAGWPFGRDVHPGELLQTLAAVEGVRYVSGLRLAAGDGPWGETAVRVAARALVAAETEIEVREDA
jgi:hypothetical protein